MAPQQEQEQQQFHAIQPSGAGDNYTDPPSRHESVDVRTGFFGVDVDSGDFESIAGGEYSPAHALPPSDWGALSVEDDIATEVEPELKHAESGHCQGAGVDDEPLKLKEHGDCTTSKMANDDDNGDEHQLQQQQEQQQDNLWLKVGAGGLAVVGAVAAFAATHHRLSEEGRRRNRAEQKSD